MSSTGAGGRTILNCLMHKLPSSRKHYHVRLVVPDNGIPFIDYRQVSNLMGSRKSAKAVHFTDLLFADKKHDASEKIAFSIYTIDKTITFLPQDETVMNEWLTKIRELHANLYPEFKRYDSIFEARLLDKGLATTMHIQGHYRLAVCKESLDLIPLLTVQDQQQQQQLLQQQQQQNTNFKTPDALASSTAASTLSNSSGIHHQRHHHHHHHHHHTNRLVHHMETNLPNNFNSPPYLQNQHQSQAHHHHHHHHLPQHLPSHQRFCKRHPQLASRTIELVLRSIRRCGHTQANFYIESGRHSQIGEGGLWMALDKKSTARQLHELLLATMKLASTTDDQLLFKAPRSRSGSSSDNAHRSQQSRSSSLVCLNADLSPLSNTSPTVTPTPFAAAATIVNHSGPGNIATITTTATSPFGETAASLTSIQSNNNNNGNNNNNNNNNDHSSLVGSGNNIIGGNFLSSLFGSQPHQQLSPAGGTATSEKSLAAEISQAAAISSISTIPMFPNHDSNTIEEDSGYLPMA